MRGISNQSPGSSVRTFGSPSICMAAAPARSATHSAQSCWSHSDAGVAWPVETMRSILTPGAEKRSRNCSFSKASGMSANRLPDRSSFPFRGCHKLADRRDGSGRNDGGLQSFLATFPSPACFPPRISKESFGGFVGFQGVTRVKNPKCPSSKFFWAPASFWSHCWRHRATFGWPAPQVERVQPTVERVYVARWRGAGSS